jgi:hypothetical protein
VPNLRLAGDPEADALLDANPLALLIGALLDQQVPVETAFAGPNKIADRIGGSTRGRSPTTARGSSPPCARTHCGAPVFGVDGQADPEAGPIADGYAAALWTSGNPDGPEVLLPGFGEQKARIVLALLGKPYGVTPKGWREAAGDRGKSGSHMSIADVIDAASLDAVKAEAKAKGR